MPDFETQDFSSPDGFNASTSGTLLERVKLHDGAAWRRFTDLYGPVIYRWARRARLQPTDAADVTQEVFQSVAEHLRSFRSTNVGDSFRGWLWTVTRNKVNDVLRRRESQPAAQGGSAAHQVLQQAPLPEQLDEPADGVTGEIAHRALHFIETEFERTTWQAFLRCTVAGQSPADVANELGMTPMAVYKAKSRVLLRLRQELRGLIE